MEKLEDRQLLAADLQLVDNVLYINGDQSANVIVVTQNDPSVNSVNVVVGSLSKDFDDVSKIVVKGGKGNDDISINVKNIDSVVYGQEGNDVIQGGGGSDYLDGGNGNDIITNFVTDENYNPIGVGSNDVLVGGNGDDVLWGGWGKSDTIYGGNGNDSIYDIVGGSNTIDGGRGDDFIITRSGVGLPTDPLNGGGLVSDKLVVDKADKKTVLFDAATQLNGPVVVGNTLYVVNLGGGDIQIDQGDGVLLVSYNGQQYSFDDSNITAIAGIGGPTNDTFTNNTDISSVFYGQGGNDTLLGGSNNDVLKGGNGNDTIDGRAGKDDITGDAGSDTLLAQDGESDIVRVDATDAVFAELGRDRIVKKKNLLFR
jgi:Ca2+-binding RTX toxin-like protein